MYCIFTIIFIDRNQTTSVGEETVSDILQALKRQIDTEKASRFNINRNNLWDGAKRGFNRPSFSPCHRLSIKFMDDMGLAEGAVDEGGPCREFLQLLMMHLGTLSPLFTGPDGDKCLSCPSNGL